LKEVVVSGGVPAVVMVGTLKPKVAAVVATVLFDLTPLNVVAWISPPDVSLTHS